MNNIDELIERLQKIASWMDQCAQQYEDISYHHQAEDIDDAITALREQQERIVELEWCAEVIDEANSKGLADELSSHFYNMSGDSLTADELDLYHKAQALEGMSVKAERQRDAAIQLAEDCCAMSVDEEIERIRGMK